MKTPRTCTECEHLRHYLEAITSEFELAIADADRPKGGQTVGPSHADFVRAMKHPYVESRIRWWARELRRALSRHDAPGDDR